MILRWRVRRGRHPNYDFWWLWEVGDGWTWLHKHPLSLERDCRCGGQITGICLLRHLSQLFRTGSDEILLKMGENFYFYNPCVIFYRTTLETVVSPQYPDSITVCVLYAIVSISIKYQYQVSSIKYQCQGQRRKATGNLVLPDE